MPILLGTFCWSRQLAVSWSFAPDEFHWCILDGFLCWEAHQSHSQVSADLIRGRWPTQNLRAKTDVGLAPCSTMRSLCTPPQILPCDAGRQPWMKGSWATPTCVNQKNGATSTHGWGTIQAASQASCLCLTRLMRSQDFQSAQLLWDLFSCVSCWRMLKASW